MSEQCDFCGSVIGWMYWRRNGKVYCTLNCEATDNFDWSRYEKEKEEGEGA